MISRPAQRNNILRGFFSDALACPIGFVTDHMLCQDTVVGAIVALTSEYCFSNVARFEYAPYIAQATTGRPNNVLDCRRIFRAFERSHDCFAISLEHGKKFAHYLDHVRGLRGSIVCKAMVFYFSSFGAGIARTTWPLHLQCLLSTPLCYP